MQEVLTFLPALLDRLAAPSLRLGLELELELELTEGCS